MSDLSDVITAVAKTVAASLYPAGTPMGATASPVCGKVVFIEEGWPSPDQLEKIYATDAAYVSIYPRPNERSTTRYPGAWVEDSRNPATYTMTILGGVITIGGAPPNPYAVQNLALLVDRAAVAVQAQPGQSAAALAAALGAAITTAGFTCSVAGAVITTTGCWPHRPVVGVVGQISRELGRQERDIQVSVWTGNPETRKAVAPAVDLALRRTPWLTGLPDGYAVRCYHVGSNDTDNDQKQGVYRRDIFYTVEYPTTESETATEIVVFNSQFTDPQGVLLATESN